MQTSLGRIYKLTLSDNCEWQCRHCSALGCLTQQNRDEAGLANSFEKARRGHYKSILISCSEALSPKLPQLIERIRSEGFRPIVQIQASMLATKQLPQFLSYDLFVVLDHLTDEIVQRLNAILKNKIINRSAVELRLFLIISQATPFEVILKKMKKLDPDLLSMTHLWAPVKKSPQDDYYSAPEVHSIIRSIKKRYKRVTIEPLWGYDYHNPDISPANELESLLAPEIISVESGVPSTDRAPQFSIVIPTYNNKDYLICTLRHLFKQNLRDEDFEIIIVDDGSDDGTQERVKQLVQEELKRNIYMKYIYFARAGARKMGDFQFRAGVARNQGVKFAIGEYVTFLDSDIVVPEHFLQDLLNRHKNFEVVQTERLHLAPEVSSQHTKIETIDIVKDIIQVEEGYWDHFHKTNNWDAMPDKWKYVCTYSLSMPLQLFKNVGWFRKNYCVYGYEDTDLGYRLAKAGAKFYLNHLQTFHLHHLTARSEFENSFHKKKLLLQHSARVFYANTLTEEVYEHLEWVLQNHLEFKLKTHDAIKSIRFVNLGRLKQILQHALWPFKKIYWFAEYQFSKRTHQIKKIVNWVAEGATSERN